MIIDNKHTGLSMDINMSFDASNYIPHHMHDSIRLYLEEGVPPGDFLQSILANDFMGAAGRADIHNRLQLYAYACLLFQLPRICWGSYEQVQQWIHLNQEAIDAKTSSDEAI